MAKVVLLDGHIIFGQAMRLLLETRDGTLVCGLCSTWDEVSQCIVEESPDLLLAHISGQASLINPFVQRIHDRWPKLSIIILTEPRPVHFIREMLDAGVRGYILESTSFEELDLAIRIVLSGYRYLTPEINDRLMTYLIDGLPDPLDDPMSRLSRHERRILELFCREWTPKMIAEELTISRKTVDIHKRNIKKKLGIGTDMGLARLALQLFPSDDAMPVRLSAGTRDTKDADVSAATPEHAFPLEGSASSIDPKRGTAASYEAVP